MSILPLYDHQTHVFLSLSLQVGLLLVTIVLFIIVLLLILLLGGGSSFGASRA